MFNYNNLVVKSRELNEANLNEKDLDIVKYAIVHHLVANLNDNRRKACEGAVNGIFHALKSQGRDDLNELIYTELNKHSSFEVV